MKTFSEYLEKKAGLTEDIATPMPTPAQPNNNSQQANQNGFQQVTNYVTQMAKTMNANPTVRQSWLNIQRELQGIQTSMQKTPMQQTTPQVPQTATQPAQPAR